VRIIRTKILVGCSFLIMIYLVVRGPFPIKIKFQLIYELCRLEAQGIVNKAFICKFLRTDHKLFVGVLNPEQWIL